MKSSWWKNLVNRIYFRKSFINLFGSIFNYIVSLVAHLVKILPAMWETWVQFLGWEDPLEKGKATHVSILAWRIPWTLQSMGLQRVGHDWATCNYIINFIEVFPWALKILFSQLLKIIVTFKFVTHCINLIYLLTFLITYCEMVWLLGVSSLQLTFFSSTIWVYLFFVIAFVKK